MDITNNPHDNQPSPIRLVDCKACGKQVSFAALLCPNCGRVVPGCHFWWPVSVVSKAWLQLSLRTQIGLASVGIGLVVLLVTCDPLLFVNRFTEENISKLHNGMTYAELTDVLGNADRMSSIKQSDGEHIVMDWGTRPTERNGTETFDGEITIIQGDKPWVGAFFCGGQADISVAGVKVPNRRR